MTLPKASPKKQVLAALDLMDEQLVAMSAIWASVLRDWENVPPSWHALASLLEKGRSIILMARRSAEALR